MTIFSPRAMGMSHHIGDYKVSLAWSQMCNEMIHRVCTLYPTNFIGVCQLPQSPGVSPDSCIEELERCVKEFGFVGCNLNPDPSGGYWTAPPLTDRWWYKFYEKMVELDVPAMVHVSASCNPCFHGTGAHYINADTTAFMQLIMGDLFKDFPTLKLIIPHGGGAVPFHWGRYRGLALNNKRPPLDEMMKNNVWFDTCVYHQPGIDLLTKVVPVDNILFASEMVGAVRGDDPQTGQAFRRHQALCRQRARADRRRTSRRFSENALRAYPRLKDRSPRKRPQRARKPPACAPREAGSGFIETGWQFRPPTAYFIGRMSQARKAIRGSSWASRLWAISAFAPRIWATGRLMARNFLGLQRIDKSRSSLAFRMDDRKQRLVVDADGGQGIGFFGWEVADAAGARRPRRRDSRRPEPGWRAARARSPTSGMSRT